MTQPVQIDLVASEVISYAAAYNGAPVVYELTVQPTDGGSHADVEVSVFLSSLGEQWAAPWRRFVPLLGPAGIMFNAPEFTSFTPDVNRLLEQRELRRAEYTVVVEKGGEELGRSVVPVTALAASSWVAGHPLMLSAETLAAYVQPHEPELATVMRRADEILSNDAGGPGLSGYQSQDPLRVDRMVDALYEAVRSRGIAYVNPPANWDLQGNPETSGQRVRLPGEVLREGLATCLDSTVLMASLIEAIGIRPLIIVIPGHAFVGYWRHDHGAALDGGPAVFADPVITVREALSDVDAGRIALLETVTLCGGEHSESAHDARLHARGHLDRDHDLGGHFAIRMIDAGAAAEFAVVVDVADVRYSGRIMPLPVRNVQEDGTVSVVEYRGQQLTLDLITDAVTRAGGGSAAGVLARDAPLRMKRWQDALLDLSRRNPLLNYRFSERSSVSLFITEKAMGVVEDLLQTGASVQLAPAPPQPNGEPLRLAARRTAPAQIEERLTTELVANRRILTTLAPDDFAPRLRRMMTTSRSVAEETGSNGLYLALGMVAWVPQGHETEHYAPLILVPVSLKPSDRNRRFSLEIDPTGVITPNFSLAERLKQEFDLDLPKLIEPETDGAGVDIDGLIAYMRQRFMEAGLRDFRVDAACSLGFFDFSTYRLWRDLSDHWPTFMQNSALVKHLVEKPTQTFADPTDGDRSDDQELDDFAATLPVLADASQALAVRQALDGATFVLQGPPGSGKSQTITNLLARALHSGKRVLFVAEKAGALGVVRDRLTAVGLGAFGLNLHDKGMRPADVRRQLTEALDAAAATDRIGFDAAERDIDRAITPLQQYPQQLHAVGHLGESAYSARNKLLAVPTQAHLPVPAAFVASVDQETVERVRRAFREVREVAARAGEATANPWSFGRAGAAAFAPEDRARFSMLVAEVASAHAAVTAEPAALAFLQSVESFEELRATSRLVHRTIDLTTVDAASAQDAVQARAHVLATLEGFDVDRLFAGASPKVLEAPVAELRAQADLANASFFIGRKKRVRAVIDRVLQYTATGHAIEQVGLLPMLSEIEKLQAFARDYLDYLRAMPGIFIPPSFNLLKAEDRQAVEVQVRELDADVQLARAGAATSSDRIRTLIHAGPSAGIAVGTLADALSALLGTLDPAPGSLELWCGTRSIAETLQSAVPAWRADAEERDFVLLRRWLELRELLAPLEELGLDDAALQVAAGAVPSNEVDMAFERGYLSTVLRKQLDDQSLDAFDGSRHDAHADAFAVAADTLRRLSPGVLADDMIANRGFQPGAQIGAVGELRRELGKQRGFKPIRRLLRDHWSVISRVTPLVLAVPDALVRFVDGDLEPFDLVVFDEASQIKVAHAIGALGRARSAVIVGDSKQMPPTSIAQVGSGDDDETTDADSDAVPRDEESILTECLRAWVPETYLTWHYRSEDETLIAFSNRTYYEGRLSTLPAPTASVEHKGLSFVKVDGRFVRQTRGAGADRGTNRAEAEAIVAEVVRRVNDEHHPGVSIGVVTLNRPQQELVQSLLLGSEDAAVLAALNPEEVDEPVTVWNLETVQGHERDVILFSIGFSKDENGKLSRNFGPLVHAGGERRLNVAVTRARRQVVVYCSFEPEDLRAEGMSEGLQQLAEYLRLAKSGPTASGATGSSPVAAPDRHRDEVADALRSRGLRVATRVGLSDFKVDIAVARVADAGDWSVGILTDGEAWKSRQTVGDRDSLPLVLLTDRMGWPAVTRIWTPDWLRDREGLLDRLEALVDDVESGERPLAPETVRPTAVSAPSKADSAAGGAVPIVQAPDEPAAPTWVEWEPGGLNPSWVLDQLHDQKTRAYIATIVGEIVATEGPVLAARAARHVGRLHGLDRVREARVQAIIAAIGDAIPLSADGFYFPAGTNPDEFLGWAVAEAGTRKVDEISLVEISNAMAHIARVGLGASRDELVSASASAMGFLRVTAGIRERMEAAVADGLRRGVLREEGPYLVATAP